MQGLVDAAGSLEQLQEDLPIQVRSALDEIIDTERTGRIWVSELEKEEKAYNNKTNGGKSEAKSVPRKRKRKTTSKSTQD